jgi:hypothetical protein
MGEVTVHGLGSIHHNRHEHKLCMCVRACVRPGRWLLCLCSKRGSKLCVCGGGGCIKLAVIGMCHSEQGMQSVACHVAVSGCGLIW